jgi:hypothetical protein
VRCKETGVFFFVLPPISRIGADDSRKIIRTALMRGTPWKFPEAGEANLRCTQEKLVTMQAEKQI